MQEALARAWERAGTEQIRSLPAWVTRVALNLSRSRWRRLRAEARATDLLRQSPDPPPAESGPDVQQALAQLSRRQREVTVLRYYLGMDVREIAGVLGVREGTVKTQLSRARRALAELLGDDEQEEVDNPAGFR